MGAFVFSFFLTAHWKTRGRRYYRTKLLCNKLIFRDLSRLLSLSLSLFLSLVASVCRE